MGGQAGIRFNSPVAWTRPLTGPGGKASPIPYLKDVCVCVRNQREGGISMVISLDMIDMHVISDCARMIFSEITWHMADMNVMMTVSQGTDLTKK